MAPCFAFSIQSLTLLTVPPCPRDRWRGPRSQSRRP